MTDTVLVKMRHIRQAGICRSGLREGASRLGIDVRRLKDGVPVSEFEGRGDLFAEKVAARAREEHDGR